jgi:hypothetical protein
MQGMSGKSQSIQLTLSDHFSSFLNFYPVQSNAKSQYLAVNIETPNSRFVRKALVLTHLLHRFECTTFSSGKLTKPRFHEIQDSN